MKWEIPVSMPFVSDDDAIKLNGKEDMVLLICMYIRLDGKGKKIETVREQGTKENIWT